MASEAGSRAPFPHRRWVWLAAAVVVLAAAVTLVDVSVVQPRVTVRWQADLGPERRAALESQYALRNGEPIGPTTWRYELGNRSRENIGALVGDPAVDDTGYIDRESLTAERPTLGVTIRPLRSLIPFPFSADEDFPDPRKLFQIQTFWLLAAAGLVLWAARSASARLRGGTTIAALLVVAATGLAFPVSPTLVHMGDANFVTEDTEKFEAYAGVSRVRFEAHLSYVVLGRLYEWMGADAGAPVAAQATLARAATVWFVLCALVVGALERWSSVVLRYLGLSLLAPASLFYFGWREFGYLSMNVATFPLLLQGLRSQAGRLEAGSILAGLGAALHGFGLVSLAGAMGAALAAAGTWADRIDRAFRVAAWGCAAYLGWVAIYVLVLDLPIVAGHAEGIPWRPWFTDTVGDGRLNVAIFSAAGMRDVLMTCWVVGTPLLLVAASLWRSHRDEVRTALAYSLPSVAFVICFWPVQGLDEEMDLIIAAFPAIYALNWACAHDGRRAALAAGLLVSAHLAFWRMLLDARFAAQLVGPRF